MLDVMVCTVVEIYGLSEESSSFVMLGKYKTTGLSETSVNFYHTALGHAPEGGNFR
jgi:hypothetical protein